MAKLRDKIKLKQHNEKENWNCKKLGYPLEEGRKKSIFNSSIDKENQCFHIQNNYASHILRSKKKVTHLNKQNILSVSLPQCHSCSASLNENCFSFQISFQLYIHFVYWYLFSKCAQGLLVKHIFYSGLLVSIRACLSCGSRKNFWKGGGRGNLGFHFHGENQESEVGLLPPLLLGVAPFPSCSQTRRTLTIKALPQTCLSLGPYFYNPFPKPFSTWELNEGGLS